MYCVVDVLFICIDMNDFYIFLLKVIMVIKEGVERVCVNKRLIIDGRWVNVDFVYFGVKFKFIIEGVVIEGVVILECFSVFFLLMDR